MSKSHLPSYSPGTDPELHANGRAVLAPLGPVSAPPPLRVDDEDDTVDLGQYLKALQRRWPVALLTLGIVVALGLLYTALQKPIYQSLATIIVSTPGGSNDGTAEDLVGNVIGAGSQTRSLGQQLAIIKSPFIQEGAAKRITEQQRQELARYVRSDIQPEPQADAINVLVQGYYPAAVAALANAICAEYIQQSQEQNRAQVRAATGYVEKQLGLVRGRLDMASRDLRNYREKSGTIDLTAESQALISQVGALESNRRTVQTGLLGNQAQVGKLQEQMNKLAPDATTPTVIVRTPAVEARTNKLTQLQIERNTALRDYKPNSRIIRDLDKQIAGINAQLQNQAQTQVQSWQPNPLRQALNQQMATLQSQIWSGEAQLGAIDRSVSEARTDLKKLPERAYALGKLQTDQATLQETYQTLNQKYQALRIQEEARVANARVLAPAKVPFAPISPRKMFNLMASFVLGLMLAVLMALLVDRLDDRVHGDEDVELATGLPILSHVAVIKESGGQLLAGHTGTSPLLESFRMLRTNIAFAGLDEPLRSIAVTSSQPGEGKSTSAANLATVVALGGKEVIIVDCDLRRPSLHKVFGLPNTVGFSSVAAGLSTLEDAIQQTSVPGLRILTSGPIPPNPPELLDSRGGRRTLKSVIDNSSFAVFDCPPALILTDAQIVATAADAVLLVVSSNEANKHDVARTSRLVSQAGAKMLGVLFNKVTASASRYGYYKYGKYTNYGGYFDKSTPNGEQALDVEAIPPAATGTNANGTNSTSPNALGPDDGGANALNTNIISINDGVANGNGISANSISTDIGSANDVSMKASSTNGVSADNVGMNSTSAENIGANDVENNGVENNGVHTLPLSFRAEDGFQINGIHAPLPPFRGEGGLVSTNGETPVIPHKDN